MAFIYACLFSDVTSSKPQKIIVDDCELLVVKTLDEQVWIFNYFCTHADKPLDKGKWDPETGHLLCPFHKAVFSIKEAGKVLAPPASVPLKVYSVEIRTINSEKQVFVDLDF